MHYLAILYLGIRAFLLQSCLNHVNSVSCGSNVSSVNSIQRGAASISDDIFNRDNVDYEKLKPLFNSGNGACYIYIIIYRVFLMVPNSHFLCVGVQTKLVFLVSLISTIGGNQFSFNPKTQKWLLGTSTKHTLCNNYYFGIVIDDHWSLITDNVTYNV